MGGAVTNLTAVMLGLERYDPDEVQGTVLAATEVERQIELYRRRTAEQRRAIVGLQPARAEVILAGACVVRTVLRKLGRERAHGQRSRPAPRAARRALRTARAVSAARVLPVLDWLPRYDRRLLRGDIVAGIAVTALIVPKDLGYAGIAGVPLQNGLYAAAAGALFYASVLHLAADLHRAELVPGGGRGRRGARDRADGRPGRAARRGDHAGHRRSVPADGHLQARAASRSSCPRRW